MKNKLLICGSRSWTDKEYIKNSLRELEPSEWLVIHGAAKGADRLGGEAAKELGFEVEEFPAEWKVKGIYNANAGKERNLKMLDYEPTVVWAFWDGNSPGTKHTVTHAMRRGIEVTVVTHPLPQ